VKVARALEFRGIGFSTVTTHVLTLCLRELLAKNNMILTSCSLASVDLVLYGFFILSKLKMMLMRREFNITTIQVKLRDVFYERL
jgi:hypothetical protein